MLTVLCALLKILAVDSAKAEFQRVLNWTESLNRHAQKIENIKEEMEYNLRELKEKIRIAREEANNVRGFWG